MKPSPLFVLLATVLAGPVSAADTPVDPGTEGTLCVAREIRKSSPEPISCEGVGEFASVAAIYAGGYRIVSSGQLAEAGEPVYLIIERK